MCFRLVTRSGLQRILYRHQRKLRTSRTYFRKEKRSLLSKRSERCCPNFTRLAVWRHPRFVVAGGAAAFAARGVHHRGLHARGADVDAQHAGRRVLIVTHGGVLDMLWRTAQGLPLHGPRECDIPNTGINRLRWTGDRLQILRWAEADHLAGLPVQPSTAQVSVPDEA